ncbi:uncharacterized protein METZ01_LOCUS318223, partial [marine metagenome]
VGLAINVSGQDQSQDNNAQKIVINIDLFNVKDENKAAYEKGETGVWKQYHQQKMKDGQMFGWALYKVAFPAGSETDFNYLTVNFRNPNPVANARSNESQWQAAHPTLDSDKISRLASDLVKLRKSVGSIPFTPLDISSQSADIGRYAVFSRSKLNVDVKDFYKALGAFSMPIVKRAMEEDLVKAHFAGYHSDEDTKTVIRGFGIDSADKVLQFKPEDFAQMAAEAHESLNPEELQKASTAFRSTYEEQMSILAVLIDSAFAE